MVDCRYGAGTGALLVPLYGAGELPQAFCRVAAVAGALYVLRRPLAAVLLRGGRCVGVRTRGGQVPPYCFIRVKRLMNTFIGTWCRSALSRQWPQLWR